MVYQHSRAFSFPRHGWKAEKSLDPVAFNGPELCSQARGQIQLLRDTNSTVALCGAMHYSCT